MRKFTQRSLSFLSLTLLLSLCTPSFGFEGENNQETVLEQLQTITSPTIQEFAVLFELLQLDPEEQFIALDQLSGVQYTSLTLNAEITNRNFIRRLYDPLRKIIKTTPGDTCCQSFVYLDDIWFDIGFDKTHINQQNCIQGLNWDGFDLSLGAQFKVDPSLTIGFGGSYERDKINYRLGGNGRYETFLAGIYTLYRPADYYILGDIVMGYGNYHVKRPIDIGSFHFNPGSSPESYQGTIYLEAGKDLAMCHTCNTYLFQPFIGIESTYIHLDKIIERSSDPLFNISAGSRINRLTSGRLGLHFSAEIWGMSFAADGAWQYRFTNFNQHNKVHFQQFGDEFSVQGICLSRDSFDGAVNISTKLCNSIRVYLEGAGQIWSNASTYNVFGGIQIDL